MQRPPNAAIEARKKPFPEALYDLVSYCHSNHANILTWAENGSGFVVLDRRGFEFDILPLFFRHGKFTSLERQLANYGFKRDGRGPYRHERQLFHRDFPEIAKLIRLRKPTGKRSRCEEVAAATTLATSTVASANETVVAGVPRSDPKRSRTEAPGSPPTTTAESSSDRNFAQAPGTQSMSRLARIANVGRHERSPLLPMRLLADMYPPMQAEGNLRASPLSAVAVRTALRTALRLANPLSRTSSQVPHVGGVDADRESQNGPVERSEPTLVSATPTLTSRPSLKELLQQRRFTQALNRIRASPNEVLQCEDVGFNFVYTASLENDVPLELVRAYLDAGGGASIAFARNAVNDNLLMYLVCSKLGDERRDNLIRLILERRPDFVLADDEDGKTVMCDFKRTFIRVTGPPSLPLDETSVPDEDGYFRDSLRRALESDPTVALPSTLQPLCDRYQALVAAANEAQWRRRLTQDPHPPKSAKKRKRPESLLMQHVYCGETFPTTYWQLLLQRSGEVEATETNENGQVPIVLAIMHWSKNLSEGATNLIALIERFPHAAGRKDNKGRLPLHVALDYSVKWGQGLAAIAHAFPPAATIEDPCTGLPPFAVALMKSDSVGNDSDDEAVDLEAAYRLLRTSPEWVLKKDVWSSP